MDAYANGVAPETMRQGVYKVSVTCTMNYSIQSVDKSWEKSGVSITSEVGPGYPTPELMRSVMDRQMHDACDGCQQQIDEIAKRIMGGVR